ncbi:hypothetical protein MMG00_00695 [Ignatzschineria rhizosphaerae]|uniref:Lipoprotein n=1 Tax=Ignatzschineria rhizosphaerae TaxID=2923279 RepID=A0ABY3X3U0_9GAMM|nr:hypothetical protein [Ignatzschineria rhizosphaerae]UNM96426.1 hypothetical protein MMG00_00695 [Ignatzschineria rhizosphaerae]
MKKSLLISALGALVFAGCSSAPKSVSYADYKETNRHDTELVSDKHIDSYAACVRDGLRSYQPTETKLSGNGIRLTSQNHFVVEIYKAIDSTYARADSEDQKIVSVLQGCK